jgi:HrpA-like RNA helicase
MKKFVIFELYSSLPLENQKIIFKNQPAGTRKFVISTNIA